MVAGAIVGSALLGVGASVYSGNKASSAAGKASQAQTTASNNQAQTARDTAAAQLQASTDQLNFQKSQYNNWQAIYGPVASNLSSFYQNLTADNLAASGIQNYEQQYAQHAQSLQRAFAQRGIDSTAQDALTQQADLARAQVAANIRTTAPGLVATAQQGFLDHNVTNPATTGVANSYTNKISALGSGGAGVQAAFGTQANLFGQQAAQANQQAMAGYRGAGQAITGGINSYMQYQAYQAYQAHQQQAPVIQQQPTYAQQNFAPANPSSAYPSSAYPASSGTTII